MGALGIFVHACAAFTCVWGERVGTATLCCAWDSTGPPSPYPPPPPPHTPHVGDAPPTPQTSAAKSACNGSQQPLSTRGQVSHVSQISSEKAGKRQRTDIDIQPPQPTTQTHFLYLCVHNCNSNNMHRAKQMPLTTGEHEQVPYFPPTHRLPHQDRCIPRSPGLGTSHAKRSACPSP